MAIVHPIFSVLVSRPELVMDHVAGYAALVSRKRRPPLAARSPSE